MLKNTILVALLVLFAAFSIRVEAHDPAQPPGTTLKENKGSDSSTAVACDCCRQCAAARKPVTPQDGEAAQAGNGCGDCCERCGREAQPPHEKIPPEIIEKKPPTPVK